MSVVIPTWNRSRLVGEAIDSALIQDGERVEVIVVDDDSTDGTSDMLARRYGSRIKLLRMSRHSGVSAARNVGFREAAGELLAYLDSDDLWLPGKLEAELAAFEHFPDADVVISDSIGFHEGRAEDRSRFMHNGLLAASRGEVRWMQDCPWLWTDIRNNAATCSITLRRSVLARLEGPYFAEDLASCEDWEFELRLYASCRVLVLPRVLAHVRWIKDDTRSGRTLPGERATREQEIRRLRNRLTVMDRARWLSRVAPELAAEFERGRAMTARLLADYGAL